MTNKEAIEFLKNMIDTQSVGAVLHNGEKALWQYHIEALNMAISALQPHWIPVTERLPGPVTDVLVTTTEGDMAIAHIVDTREGLKWDINRWVNDLEDWPVWMPLPEPWKGEQDEP